MKRIVIACLAVLAVLLNAATPTNLPPRKTQLPPGDRFLFVVDTSSGMSKFATGSRQVVFDLIYSGISGHMRPGDTYGLWPFNEEVQAGKFPMQLWKTNALDLASTAGRFLREQPCEKKARLDLALDKIKVVVNTVKDLTAFIITDGRTAFEGTPFDENLNTTAKKRADEARKIRKPLIVTLVARGGDFASWSVTLPGENIPMPEHSLPPVIAQAPTNRPPPVVASASARPMGTPIIIQKSTRPAPAPTPSVAAEPAAATPLESNSAPSAAVQPPTSTEPASSSEPRPEIPVPSAPIVPTSGVAAFKLPLSFTPTAAPPVTLRPKNASMAAVEPPPPPADPVSNPLPPAVLPGTNPSQLARAPLESSPASRLFTTMTVSAREPTSAPAARQAGNGVLAVTPTPVISVPGVNPLVMLAIGATLLVAAMVLTVLFIYNLRQPRRVSIISQSIDRSHSPDEKP